jgi:nitrate/nitrite-specific signal transduction histidine kinase
MNFVTIKTLRFLCVFRLSTRNCWLQRQPENIAEHAEASKIYVSGKVQQDTVYFLVEDNGIGFNVDKFLTSQTIGKGYGLITIEQRIKMLRGTLQIQSKKGKGTKITFSISIDSPASSKLVFAQDSD